MIKDATGREFVIGQLVELPLIGMFRAIVANIVEAPRVLAPGAQPFPPRLVLQVILEQMADQQGQVPNVYIVREPPQQQQKPDPGLHLVEGDGKPS